MGEGVNEEHTLNTNDIADRIRRSRARKLLPQSLVDTARAATDPDVILLDWVDTGPVRENWGDAIAPMIVERLSGRPVVNRRGVVNLRHRPVHTGIGSMLGYVDVDHLVVWGSGIVESGATPPARRIDAHAVRGPATRDILVRAGHDCPELFGDPALLFPRLYQPRQSGDRSLLGIIPHFRDHDLPAVQTLAGQPGVRIIDIRSGIERVVDEMAACDHIASSSLHGLVAADGYGIPAIWITMSDRPFGGGFKFRDYLATTTGRPGAPVAVDASTTAADLIGEMPTSVGLPDVERFLEACPFLDASRIRDDGTIR
jgi:pyruvyltransferase